MAEGLLPQCQEAMTAIKGALQYFWAFANCCKSGSNAELRLIMEDGQLKVNMSAFLGPVRPQSKDGLWLGLHKTNNSQSRRRERRAAGRAAAAAEEVGAGARKAAEVSAANAEASEAVIASAAEKAAAKGTVACAAEQVAAVVAEEASAKKDTTEEVTAVAVSEKAPDKMATAEKVRMAAIEGKESASTSTENASGCCPTTSVVALPDSTCWNCEDEMTRSHQCGDIATSSSCLPPPILTPSLEVLSPAAARLRPDPSAPYIIKGKIRHLDGSPIVKPRLKK